MKARKFPSIAIKAIALLFVFAALPYLASAQEITNFEYDGYDASRQADIFSWDTVAAGGDITMQFRGGGISSVWIGVQTGTASHSNGTTTIAVTPLQNAPGTEIEYRAKVGNSSWSETISLSFD